MELGQILFNDGSDDYVVCRQDFVFLALKFVVTLRSAYLSSESKYGMTAHLLKRDIWVVVVVTIELQSFYVGEGAKSWTGYMVVILNTA